MKVMKSVLFILDKWCEGNPSFGIAEWEYNIFRSLESTGLAICETFHFDDYYFFHQQVGDEALVRKCLDFKPDMICIIIYEIPGSAFNVPTLRTLDIIRNQLNIPMISIWGDIQCPSSVKISKMILPFVDLNVCTASSAAVSRIAQPKKYAYFWVPKDPRCFYNPSIERDIPMSYVGSPKIERLAAIDSLRRNGIDVDQTGGERKQHISTDQYAKILQRSKMTLSFSRSERSHVTNARAFEATLCGTMLLEEEGFETAKLFTPFVDYVPYSSHRDLVKKANYYLAHDNERQEIAHRGCRKAHEQYSAARFWRLVFNRVCYENSEIGFDENTLKLTPEKLSKLPLRRSLKLRLLNGAYSNVAVYTIISGFHRILTMHFAKQFFRTLIK